MTQKVSQGVATIELILEVMGWQVILQLHSHEHRNIMLAYMAKGFSYGAHRMYTSCAQHDVVDMELESNCNQSSDGRQSLAVGCLLQKQTCLILLMAQLCKDSRFLLQVTQHESQCCSCSVVPSKQHTESHILHGHP